MHEFRDLLFESELVRNKINFKTDIINHSLPLSTQKGKSIHNFHYFRFKSLLSLYIGGKELFIKHDEACSVDGTLMGSIKCSSNNSCLFQSFIEILPSHNNIESLTMPVKLSKSATNNNSLGKRQRKRFPTQNLFEREKVISPISNTMESKIAMIEDVGKNQPKAIEKKGFDIDTSF
ncbi:MAG: hypothetical protein J6R12_03210 [Bacteroidales bacterium]|nr:hypothetical protein [Bacteroidales bacterium]